MGEVSFGNGVGPSTAGPPDETTIIIHWSAGQVTPFVARRASDEGLLTWAVEPAPMPVLARAVRKGLGSPLRSLTPDGSRCQCRGGQRSDTRSATQEGGRPGRRTDERAKSLAGRQGTPVQPARWLGATPDEAATVGALPVAAICDLPARICIPVGIIHVRVPLEHPGKWKREPIRAATVSA